MRFDLTIDIRRSPGDVFRFLRDKDKFPQKPGSPVLVLEQTTPGPAGVGTRYREVVRMFPCVRGEIFSTVTRFEFGRRLEEEVIFMVWHAVTRLADGLYRIVEPIGTVEPGFGVATANMYLVVGRDRAALIDSGMGIGDVLAEVRKITALPCMVLNTHYHWDHVGANDLFDESAIHGCETGLLVQEQDTSWILEAAQSPAARAVLPASFDPAAYRIAPGPAALVLEDNDLVDLGGRMLRVLHTPGHSPGHAVFMDEANGVLFTGDAAYQGPVYACFDDSDPVACARSARRLAGLEGVRMTCPGHNDIVMGRDWLRELAEGFEAALAGRVAGKLRGGLIPAREFSFGSFSIWLPR